MPLPIANKIDFGSTPRRTKKAITLRCNAPTTDVLEQGMSGLTNKFEQRVTIDVYARDIKAEGLRQGREPADLVAIEKYLVDFLALNRLALQADGIQYMEVLNSQTFAEIAGGGDEDMQQVWYHTSITVMLHYWMKVVEMAL